MIFLPTTNALASLVSYTFKVYLEFIHFYPTLMPHPTENHSYLSNGILLQPCNCSWWRLMMTLTDDRLIIRSHHFCVFNLPSSSYDTQNEIQIPYPGLHILTAFLLGTRCRSERNITVLDRENTSTWVGVEKTKK